MVLDGVLDVDDVGEMIADALLAGSAVDGLDSLMARAYPDGGWAEYRRQIEIHGNPADQIERFEKAGIIMQPKQLEFCGWARRMDTNDCIEGEKGTPELAIGGARGGHKSHTVFTQTAIDDCARFPGCRVLYLRKVGKNAQEQFERLRQAVLGHTKHSYIKGLIRFPKGSQIRIGHFNCARDIDDYLGMEYEIIIIEEWTALPKTAHQAMRNSNRTAMAMMPRIYNSTNPLGVGHLEYKKRYVLHERKNSNVTNRRRKFIATTVYDNRFVNQEYVGNLEENTGAELRAYLYGDWDVPAGAYFETFNYDLHTREQMEIPRNWIIWASMDYGFQHWNMIYFHTKYDGLTYTFHELAHRKHYVSEIVPEIKLALAEYGRRIDDLEVFLVGSDVFAKRGEAKRTVGQQYEDFGIPMTAALTGPGSRIAGAHHMSKLLGNPVREIDPKWVITRNCPRLVETLPSLERNPNNPEDVLKVDMADDGSGGDDAYDGSRYGLYRRRVISHGTTTQKSGF